MLQLGLFAVWKYILQWMSVLLFQQIVVKCELTFAFRIGKICIGVEFDIDTSRPLICWFGLLVSDSRLIIAPESYSLDAASLSNGRSTTAGFADPPRSFPLDVAFLSNGRSTTAGFAGELFGSTIFSLLVNWSYSSKLRLVTSYSSSLSSIPTNGLMPICKRNKIDIKSRLVCYVLDTLFIRLKVYCLSRKRYEIKSKNQQNLLLEKQDKYTMDPGWWVYHQHLIP